MVPAGEHQIVRRGRGTIKMSVGQKFSIEGWQPSADAAEFNIKPDASGEDAPRQGQKQRKQVRQGNPR
jgi:hypothetical protein